MENNRKKEVEIILQSIAKDLITDSTIISEGEMSKKAREIMLVNCERFIDYNKELNDLSGNFKLVKTIVKA